MLFSSPVFLIFFLPVVLILYFNPICKSRKYRNVVLLLASLFFYIGGEHRFIFVLLLSLFINWQLGKCIADRKNTKIYLICAIIWNIGVLFVYKYMGFALLNLKALHIWNADIISLTLPLGISFFTFQILSYIFDLYMGKTTVQKSFWKFSLYVLMFPQLVAGPIVRYEDIATELDCRKENVDDFCDGFIRFIYGLGKKVLISNPMGIIADNMFYLSKESTISVISAWIGAITYTLQIYYDFSGYSDMAIGLGKVFGFHFPENFNYPYCARSITDFWKRWHMSLSTWFRDYIYIPLGGNRCGFARGIINMLIVWFLTGLWHGANWTFVLWGLGYFLLLVLERMLGLTKSKLGYLYTLPMVIILWVVFRADSIGGAFHYIGQMFGMAGMAIDAYAVACIKNGGYLMVIAVILAMPVKTIFNNKIRLNADWKRMIKAIVAIPIFVLCIAKCMQGAYNPFIYFNF